MGAPAPKDAAAPEPIERGSAGTAHILPRERAKASFATETLTNILDGGEEYTTQRRFKQALSSNERRAWPCSRAKTSIIPSKARRH